ncbi:MAG TPA: glycosyltransferase family 4 protein [Chloroflexota bacterium]|nr:glycosyltransferase family 4 protein [Chloroflexota bacterium]
MNTVALLQDPAGRGGTNTVVSWYRRWNKAQGICVYECYLDDTRKGWPAKPALLDPTGSLAVPRFLPRLHVPQYFAARRQLRRIWSGVEVVHVVGAVCIQGSLAPATIPAIIWTATTIADERCSIVPLVSPARRLLYRSTLPLLRRLEAMALTNAKKVYAMSRHTADVLLSYGVDHHKVDVLPVPIDTTRFSPGKTERRGVLFVGRVLDPRKGFSRVITLAATSRLTRAHGVAVVSLGEQAAVWPRDLAGAIRWWGPAEKLEECYRSAEVLVLPSYQEGLGIVAFESLACGTPVVAYRCGGPDHFLQESGGGIVVDDDQHFRTAVEALLGDAARRQEMGDVGRAWVNRNMNGASFLGDSALFSL